MWFRLPPRASIPSAVHGWMANDWPSSVTINVPEFAFCSACERLNEYSIFEGVWAAAVDTQAISSRVVIHNFRIVISLSVRFGDATESAGRRMGGARQFAPRF